MSFIIFFRSLIEVCNTCSKAYIFLRVQHDEFLYMGTSVLPSPRSRFSTPSLLCPFWSVPSPKAAAHLLSKSPDVFPVLDLHSSLMF